MSISNISTWFEKIALGFSSKLFNSGKKTGALTGGLTGISAALQAAKTREDSCVEVEFDEKPSSTSETSKQKPLKENGKENVSKKTVQNSAELNSDSEPAFNTVESVNEYGNKIKTQYENGIKVAEIEYSGDSNDVINLAIFEYDESGKLIAQTNGPANGVANEKIQFIYDEKGNLIKEFAYANSSKNSEEFTRLANTTEYFYDENGNVIKKSYRAGADSTDIYYKYDQNGKMISWLRDKNGNGVMDNPRTEVYSEKEYDDKNRVIKSTYTCSDGTYIDQYEYDENGNVAKIISKAGLPESGNFCYTTTLFEDGKKIKEINIFDTNYGGVAEKTYTYDENGRTDKEIIKHENGITERCYNYDDKSSKHTIDVSEYNKDGQLIESYHDKDANGAREYPERGSKFVYDEQGRVIKKIETGQDMSYLNLYEYDENNNIVDTKTAYLRLLNYYHFSQFEELKDEDGDGIIDSVLNYTHSDEYGNAKIEIDENLDGVADKIYIVDTENGIIQEQ